MENLELLVSGLRAAQADLLAENRELRDGQRSVLESMRRYADLYEQAPVAFLTLDADGIVRDLNLAGRTLLGKQRAHAVGMAFPALVSLHDEAAFWEHLSVCRQIRATTVNELLFSTASGELHYVQMMSVPFFDLFGDVTFRTSLTDITARKVAEQELFVAKAQLEAVLRDVSDDFVAFDDQFRFSFIGKVDAERFHLAGKDPVDLIGKVLWDVSPELVGSEAEVKLRDAMARRVPVGYELTQAERIFAVRVTPSPDGGVFVISLDITEQNRAHALARLLAEQLASAVEAIPDPIALWDVSDRLVACNAAFREPRRALFPDFLGTSYEQSLRRAEPLYHYEDEAARVQFWAERAARRDEAIDTYNLTFTDGRTFRITVLRIPSGGFVSIGVDLTADLVREREVETARAAAEAASQAKSDLVSSLSHELRTPLNAILGFCQLLQRDKKEKLSDRQREMVDQICKGGDTLLRLINGMLDLAAFEANGLSVALEPVSATDIVRDAARALDLTAREAGVSLTIEEPLTDGDLPFVEADPLRFAQIVMNFGSNAIKYNRRGGNVTFRVYTGGHGVRVSVSDTGIGIAQEKHLAVFRPFDRAGQESGPIEGTGIGLSISKRLAEMMNGSVGFQSALGEGSTFWVELPVHASSVRRSSKLPEDLPSSTLGAVERSLILYVEDNQANVTFVRHALSVSENIELISASTGEAGIELARARRPHAVLMDVNLPGMNGFEALRALQHHDETRDIPVIALSAAASEIDRRRGEAAGFFRYLTKPVSVVDLEAALRVLLPRAWEQ